MNRTASNRAGGRISSHFAVAIAVGLLTLNCGGSSPTAPSAPQVVQVGGVWSGTIQLASVTGGECVGDLMQAAIGQTDTVSLSISQFGASLTATSTVAGSTIPLSGTAGTDSITLNWPSTSTSVLTGIPCANSAVRDMRTTAISITATVSGASATGTQTETYDVLASGTTQSVGVLTAKFTLTMTKR